MKKNTRFLVPICVFSLFAFTLQGCGARAKPADMPALQPCSITFIQEGKPLSGANIILHSSDSDFKWGVGGVTDENGVVVLKTNGFYDGVPVGTYKISLTKLISDGPPPPSSLPDDEDERTKIMNEYAKQVTHYSTIPAEFRKKDSTSLEIEVVKGKNEKTLDLGKEVKDIIVMTD